MSSAGSVLNAASVDTLRRVVRSELLKIRTTKLWWIIALCVLVLAGGYAALYAGITALQANVTDTAAFTDLGAVSSVYNGGNTIARILVLVVGIMAMGGEYRHKTLTSTYLATPRRMTVLAGKAISLVAYGLLYGALSVLAGAVVAVPFLLYFDASPFLTSAAMWRSLVLGVVSIAFWTLMGMGIGILIRSMIVAMLVGIGFAYIVEPGLTLLFFIQGWDVPLNLMPSGATNAVLGITNPALFASPNPFDWWAGLLVLLGWSLLPAVIGVFTTVRKDVP